MEINGLRLKEIRKKLGLTQQQLAELLLVSDRTVKNWEAGGVVPKTKSAILNSLEGNNAPNIINQNKNSPNAILGNNNKVTTTADNTALIELYKNRIEALEIENKYLKDRISYYEATNEKLLNLLNKQ